jgi:hypothetical protein
MLCVECGGNGMIVMRCPRCSGQGMVVADARSPSVAISKPVPPPLPSASHHQHERDVSADKGRPVAVWIYVDSRKQVGDLDHLKVFPSEDAANAWFAEHDPEGGAFEYPVIVSL